MTLHQVVTKRLAEMGETSYTLRNNIDRKTYFALHRIVNRRCRRITTETAERVAEALSLRSGELTPFVAELGRYRRKRKPNVKRPAVSQSMKNRWARLRELEGNGASNGTGPYIVLNSQTGEIVARF